MAEQEPDSTSSLLNDLGSTWPSDYALGIQGNTLPGQSQLLVAQDLRLTLYIPVGLPA